MIKFRAYRQGQLITEPMLEGAYLLGQDEVPVRGEIKNEQGDIIGLRREESAVGLANMWEVEGFGRVCIGTTLLAEREKA